MTAPQIATRENRAIWAGIGILALGQAAALIAGVAGTRMAFASLDQGQLSQAALALIAGAAGGLAGCRFALRLLCERLGQTYTANVRKALLAQAMATPPDRIAARRRGYLMLRLTGDMTTLKDGLARSFPPVLQACALIPAALAALFWVNTGFGAVTMMVLGLSLAVIAGSWGQLRKAHESLRHARAKLAADMAERMPVAPELARLGRRGRELSRLGKATTRLRQKAERRLIWVEVLRACPGVLTGAMAVYVLHAGTRWGLAAGDLAAALAAVGLLTFTLADLSDALDRLVGWRVAHSKLAKALPTAAPIPLGNEDRVRLGGRKLTVRLVLAPEVARPHTLLLGPGARGIVHAKDPVWLLKCLTGKVFDERTRIFVNDTPLSALTAGSVRRSIGVIDAQPVLLKGSVRRNLCLGLMERPTDATLQNRIEKAGLGDLLQRFGGLDGSVSEGGRSFTARDRTGFAALQVAVHRPGLVIVAARPEELSEAASTYVESVGAIVLKLGVDGESWGL